MADRTVKIIVPADSTALISLDELKAGLGVASTDTTHDARFQLWIDQYSMVIANACNRIFGYTTVAETWRGDPPPYENNRLFLSQYPAKEADLTKVEAPKGTSLDPTTYELEELPGKLTLMGAWSEDIVVTYSGGYRLPDEAPDDLKAAMMLLVQAAWFRLSIQPTGGIRSISHRESRVMFFDPAQMAKLHGAGPLTQADDMFKSLLSAYVRIEV
jgi:hypothetical protein